MNWPPFSLLGTNTLLSQLTTKHTQAMAAFLMLIAAMLVLNQLRDWTIPRIKWVFAVFAGNSMIILISIGLYHGQYGAKALSTNPYSILVVGVFVSGAFLFNHYHTQLNGKSELLLIVVGAAVCAELSLYVPLGNDWPQVSFVRVVLCGAWIVAWCAIYFGSKTISTMIAAGIALGYSSIVFFPKVGLPNQVYNRDLPDFRRVLNTKLAMTISFGIFPGFSSQLGVEISQRWPIRQQWVRCIRSRHRSKRKFGDLAVMRLPFGWSGLVAGRCRSLHAIPNVVRLDWRAISRFRTIRGVSVSDRNSRLFEVGG